jgi:hypothetical protein
MHRKCSRSPKIVKLDLFDSSAIDLRRKIKLEHVKALYNKSNFVHSKSS